MGHRHTGEHYPHLHEGLKTIAGMAVVTFAVRGLHVVVRSRSEVETVEVASRLQDRLNQPEEADTAIEEVETDVDAPKTRWSYEELQAHIATKAITSAETPMQADPPEAA